MKVWIEDLDGPIIALYGEPNKSPRWLREISYIDPAKIKTSYKLLPASLGLKYYNYIQEVRKKKLKKHV